MRQSTSPRPQGRCAGRAAYTVQHADVQTATWHALAPITCNRSNADFPPLHGRGLERLGTRLMYMYMYMYQADECKKKSNKHTCTKNKKVKSRRSCIY